MITANNIQNIYTTDGSLSGNRIIAQEGSQLQFRANVVDAFSVDGSTFSADTENSRVGLGTNAPTAALDITGTVRLRHVNGVNGRHDDRLLVSDKTEISEQ